MSERNEISILSTLPPKRFHSCLLTSYSFDFNYFNHHALPSLARIGVRNICVFVDDAMLQQYLGTISGYSAGAAKRYSIVGAVRKGAFHPKMYLFFGRNGDGFLIIGSGNLTASGHGSNQELWGSFHIDGPNDPKALLFKQAWQFAQSIGSEAHGISQRKIGWINTHTPWLKDIPDETLSEGIEIGDGVHAYFLTNIGNGILNDLKGLIDGEVIFCTLISPFFDQKAAVLYELESLFPTAEIISIVQLDTLSGDLTGKSFNNIQFTDWDSIPPINKNRYLHAKLLHLRTNSREYLLFGSANVTAPALGTSEIPPKNEEVCLLFHRKSGDWLAELGLKNKGTLIQKETMSDFKKNLPYKDKKSASSIEYRLLALDRIGNHLDVYIKESDSLSSFSIILFDSWGENVGDISFDKAEYVQERQHYRLICPESIDIALYGQLLDTSGRPVSNKQIIHDIATLHRTNPDQNTQKLEEILDRIEFDDAELVEILSYLNPDDLVKPSPKGTGSKKEQNGGNTNDNDGSGETLDYDEFTKISPEDQVKGGLSFLYGTHRIERILETLRTIFARLKTSDIDIDGQDEETDKDAVDSSTGRSNDEDQEDRELAKQTISSFNKTQKSVFNFFNQYITILETQRKMKHKPNILDVSMFTIALHLLLDFHDKPIKIVKKSDNENGHEQILLTTVGNYFEKTDYCRIVTEIIGKFTMLFVNGIDDSNDEYVRRRIEKCRKTSYWHGLCCIAQLVTNDKIKDDLIGCFDFSEIWKWELLMNLRHFFSPENSDDEIVAHENIDHSLKIMKCEDEMSMRSQCIKTWKSLEMGYERFLSKKKWAKKGCEKFQKIYSPLTGFSHIFQVVKENKYHKITIARAGFPRSKTEILDFEEGKKVVAEKAKFKILGN